MRLTGLITHIPHPLLHKSHQGDNARLFFVWLLRKFLFPKAVQIEPQFARAYYNLGHALLDQRRLNRAVFNYSSVLQIEPENAGAHFLLGIVYLMQGKLDKVIFHNREAL